MIDTLLASLARALAPEATLAEHAADTAFAAAARDGFGFVTLHRTSNVDDPQQLEGILEVLAESSLKLPLIFAMHPRTRAVAETCGLLAVVPAERMLMTPPSSYLRGLGLMRAFLLVITGSRDGQEETTALGVPFLTVRENTERPITSEEGTNILVGTSAEALLKTADDVLSTGGKRGRVPELWGGKAAERMAECVERFLSLAKPGPQGRAASAVASAT